MNISIRSTIFTISIIALLSVGWFIYYTFFTFHITKISPDTNNIATVTPSLTVKFNRELQDIGTVIASPNPDYIYEYSFKDNEITIVLNELPENDISITLENITSVKNDTITKKLAFKPKVIDASKLPDDQLKGILERQDRNTSINADPIQAVVPHSTLNYDLTLTVSGTRPNGGDRYVIDARIMLSQADINIDENSAINRYKQDVVDYLASENIKAEDYEINYVIEKP